MDEDSVKVDWEQKVPKMAKVYPLSKKSKMVLDNTFDKLHEQGRLPWTTESTPFSFPVFVVWKTMPDGKRKGRVVVDIRGLNAMTRPDVYALPLQSEMISAVKDCKYISVIDAASFFSARCALYAPYYKALLTGGSLKADFLHGSTYQSAKCTQQCQFRLYGTLNMPGWRERRCSLSLPGESNIETASPTPENHLQDGRCSLSQAVTGMLQYQNLLLSQGLKEPRFRQTKTFF